MAWRIKHLAWLLARLLFITFWHCFGYKIRIYNGWAYCVVCCHKTIYLNVFIQLVDKGKFTQFIKEFTGVMRYHGFFSTCDVSTGETIDVLGSDHQLFINRNNNGSLIVDMVNSAKYNNFLLKMKSMYLNTLKCNMSSKSARLDRTHQWNNS